MDSKKNIKEKTPYEIYSNYNWKYISNIKYNCEYVFNYHNTLHYKSGLLIRFLWLQFIEWMIKKKEIRFGNDNTSKIIWLDLILSYLCYEFPCIESIKGHNNPINSIILMDTNIIISGDDKGLMLVNDLCGLKDFTCARKLKSDLNDSIQNIVKIDNTNIISESVDENGYNTHLLWDVSKNIYSRLESSYKGDPENLHGTCILKFNDNNIFTWTNKKLINWEIFRLHPYNARFRVFLNQYKLNKYGKENSKKYKTHENVYIRKKKSYNLTEEKVCLLKLDNNKIVIGNNNILEIWDLTENNINHQIRSLHGHEKRINGCIRLKKNKIASYDEDNKIYIWNLKYTEACINILEGHTKKITKLLSINKDIFISSSADKTIRIWNLKLKGQECVKILKGHHGSVNTIMQLDNHIIISGGSDSKLLVWDLKKFI